MKIKNIEIHWLGNAGFLIKNSKVIYIDPYNIKDGSEKADFILITHSHYDHCSLQDLDKIITPDTKILIPADCQSKVLRFDFPIKMVLVEPGKEFDFVDFRVSTVPAYNIDKSFHPKEENWVGYVIKFGDVVIYHSGDTDVIPEMKNLTGYNKEGVELVALLPVGGRFTMSAEEAAEAVEIINPDLAIPMHYNSVIGTLDDAKEFKELCESKGFRVEILEKE